MSVAPGLSEKPIAQASAPPRRTERLSIYWMRLLAVVLIVNSHFSPDAIQGFQPFFLYGYLGHLGNMIFTFGSGYVLALGFDKYLSAVGRWLLYRILYLATIILSLQMLIGWIVYGDPRVASVTLHFVVGFSVINALVYLSMLFPLLYWIGPSGRRVTLVAVSVLLAATCLAADGNLGDERAPEIWAGACDLLCYAAMFLLGIMGAKRECVSPFSGPLTHAGLFALAMVGFVAASRLADCRLATALFKSLAIFFLFEWLERLGLEHAPRWLNAAVKSVATLSLFIYLSHFVLLEPAYRLSRPLALPLILAMVIPLAYVESALFNPVIGAIKRVLLDPKPTTAGKP